MGASAEEGSGQERVPKAKTPITKRAARRLKTRTGHLVEFESAFNCLKSFHKTRETSLQIAVNRSHGVDARQMELVIF
jgi:hypothetical protein